MAIAIDPVCGMEVVMETATLTSEHDGTTYYFCGKGSKLDTLTRTRTRISTRATRRRACSRLRPTVSGRTRRTGQPPISRG
jgi:hypothetical protein